MMDKEYSCCAEKAKIPCEIESTAEKACCSTGENEKPAKTANSGNITDGTCNMTEKETYSDPYRFPGFPLYTDIDEDCCSNEGQYIKTEEKYSPPSRATAPQIEVHFTIVAHLVKPVQEGYSFIVENTHPPPPKTSRNILLQSGVMLI